MEIIIFAASLRKISERKISEYGNPFRFGTVVDSPYFTDRVEELSRIAEILNSKNHLVVISPRRFGKTSLVRKAVEQSGRQFVFLNMQQVTSIEDLASLLLRGILRQHPMERIKYLMKNFRVVPTFSTNPLNDSIEVSFQPSMNNFVMLEDTLSLAEKVSTEGNRMIVVLDEFQEIIGIEKGIDKKLRAFMQEQKLVNYIFLGSQESMMTQIFERKKSPFYHFGQLMRLDKIPYDDFFSYIIERLSVIISEEQSERIAKDILSETACHPYYTQQLSSVVWDLLVYHKTPSDEVVSTAIEKLVRVHDLDFERLWLTFNKTDRKMLQTLCKGMSPYELRDMPTSTSFSAIKRLTQDGYVIRTDRYMIEDPIFRHWIEERQT